MRLLRTRAALLSDFEVLQLLREAEEKQRAAARKEADAGADAWMKTVEPNVRTIQFEVGPHTHQTIASLSQAHRPCAHQEAAHVTAFLDDLAAQGFAPPDAQCLQGVPGLTKAERLQLVNHAPASVVELHTVRRATDPAGRGARSAPG